MLIRILFILFALSRVSQSCAFDCEKASEQKDIIEFCENYRKWDASDIDQYTFYSHSAFFGMPYSSGEERLAVFVKHKKAVKILSADLNTFGQSKKLNSSHLSATTVEELFQRAKDTIAQKDKAGFHVSISYNKDYGFPDSISVMSDPPGIQDGYSWHLDEVLDFYRDEN